MLLPSQKLDKHRYLCVKCISTTDPTIRQRQRDERIQLLLLAQELLRKQEEIGQLILKEMEEQENEMSALPAQPRASSQSTTTQRAVRTDGCRHRALLSSEHLL